jgi:hypothetical protein
MTIRRVYLGRTITGGRVGEGWHAKLSDFSFDNPFEAGYYLDISGGNSVFLDLTDFPNLPDKEG